MAVNHSTSAWQRLKNWGSADDLGQSLLANIKQTEGPIDTFIRSVKPGTDEPLIPLDTALARIQLPKDADLELPVTRATLLISRGDQCLEKSPITAELGALNAKRSAKNLAVYQSALEYASTLAARRGALGFVGGLAVGGLAVGGAWLLSRS